MSAKKEIYKPSADLVKAAHIDAEKYELLYNQSINSRSCLVLEENFSPFILVSKTNENKNTSFDGDVSIKWYEDGILNACYNCVDRHLPEKANDIALIWEGDDPNDSLHITYVTLQSEVSKLSNALKSRNVKKGDRVLYTTGGYMPLTRLKSRLIIGKVKCTGVRLMRVR